MLWNRLFPSKKAIMHGLRGQVLPLTIVLMPALIGSTGFVFIISEGRYYQRLVQDAVDVGALAGANEIQYGETTEVQYGHSKHDVAKYAKTLTQQIGTDNGVPLTVTVTFPYVDSQSNTRNDEVQVEAHLTTPYVTFNAGAFSTQNAGASAVGKGRLVPLVTSSTTDPCLFQARPVNANGNIDESLVGFDIQAPTNLELPLCTVLSNGPIALDAAEVTYSDSTTGLSYKDHTYWDTDVSYWTDARKSGSITSGDKLAAASVEIGFPYPQYVSPSSHAITNTDFCKNGTGSFVGCAAPTQPAACTHATDLVHYIVPKTSKTIRVSHDVTEQTVTYNYNQSPYIIPAGCYKSIYIYTDSELIPYGATSPTYTTNAPYSWLYSNSTVVFGHGEVYSEGPIFIAATNIETADTGSYVVSQGDVSLYSITLEMNPPQMGEHQEFNDLNKQVDGQGALLPNDTVLYCGKNCRNILDYNIDGSLFGGLVYAPYASFVAQNDAFYTTSLPWTMFDITAFIVAQFKTIITNGGKTIIDEYKLNTTGDNKNILTLQQAQQVNQPPNTACTTYANGSQSGTGCSGG